MASRRSEPSAAARREAWLALWRILLAPPRADGGDDGSAGGADGGRP